MTDQGDLWKLNIGFQCLGTEALKIQGKPVLYGCKRGYLVHSGKFKACPSDSGFSANN